MKWKSNENWAFGLVARDVEYFVCSYFTNPPECMSAPNLKRRRKISRKFTPREKGKVLRNMKIVFYVKRSFVCAVVFWKLLEVENHFIAWKWQSVVVKRSLYFRVRSSQCHVMSPFSMVKIETCSSSGRQEWIKKMRYQNVDRIFNFVHVSRETFLRQASQECSKIISQSLGIREQVNPPAQGLKRKSEWNEIRGKWNSIVKLENSRVNLL